MINHQFTPRLVTALVGKFVVQVACGAAHFAFLVDHAVASLLPHTKRTVIFRLDVNRETGEIDDESIFTQSSDGSNDCQLRCRAMLVPKVIEKSLKESAL